MKRSIAMATLALIVGVSLAGCNQAEVPEPESKTYKITFVQSGQGNVVKEVNEGGTLSEVPEPFPKTGYKVTWDRTDFTNITGNLTVNAVETANEYKIIYSLGDREDDSNAEIESRKQPVVFDSPYTLYIPKCEGYKFVKWVITGSDIEIKNGTWSTVEDVSLTAVWKIDENSDIGWSDYY